MMPDLKNMMDDELTSLQRDIKAELARRSAEKMIPVFGVQTSPLNQYEFSNPEQAISCAAELLEQVLNDIQSDIARGGLDGWNGNLLRIYVQHVNKSDFAILQPYLQDKKS
ncbi:hypothetical protein F0A41_22340 [Salmonella enterica]|nr:hypothetical protein [Salmonella enterica]